MRNRLTFCLKCFPNCFECLKLSNSLYHIYSDHLTMLNFLYIFVYHHTIHNYSAIYYYNNYIIDLYIPVLSTLP